MSSFNEENQNDGNDYAGDPCEGAGYVHLSTVRALWEEAILWEDEKEGDESSERSRISLFHLQVPHHRGVRLTVVDRRVAQQSGEGCVHEICAPLFTVVFLYHFYITFLRN